MLRTWSSISLLSVQLSRVARCWFKVVVSSRDARDMGHLEDFHVLLLLFCVLLSLLKADLGKTENHFWECLRSKFSSFFLFWIIILALFPVCWCNIAQFSLFPYFWSEVAKFPCYFSFKSGMGSYYFLLLREVAFFFGFHFLMIKDKFLKMSSIPVRYLNVSRIIKTTTAIDSLV